MGNILLQAIAFVFLPIFIIDNTSQRQVESLYRAVIKTQRYLCSVLNCSVVTGDSRVNIRLLPFATSDFYITVQYELNASINNT